VYRADDRLMQTCRRLEPNAIHRDGEMKVIEHRRASVGIMASEKTRVFTMLTAKNQNGRKTRQNEELLSSLLGYDLGYIVQNYQ